MLGDWLDVFHSVNCLVGVGGFGADESADITNEFGGRMDPQLFGK